MPVRVKPAAPLPPCSSLRTRVYYEDTDAGAIVYHASYLRWMERARTEWLRTLGVTKLALDAQHGLLWVVSELSIAYRSPARLDDTVRIDVALQSVRRASLSLIQTCWAEPEPPSTTEARLLTHASVRLALIHRTTGHPQPLPPELLERIQSA